MLGSLHILLVLMVLMMMGHHMVIDDTYRISCSGVVVACGCDFCRHCVLCDVPRRINSRVRNFMVVLAYYISENILEHSITGKRTLMVTALIWTVPVQ